MDFRPNTYDTTLRGMLHKLKMVQAITQNLENANSIGYKRQIPESMSFGTILNEITLKDTSVGPLKKTNNTFDLAIEGNAYFLVDAGDGSLTQARNGNFRLNEKGELATQDGKKVVVIERSDKPVSLASDFDIKINENGEIFVGLERYGRIAMKIMDNKPVRIHQGFVEGSNVDLGKDMATLMMTFRSFEALEKSLGMEAGLDKELIEKYGRNV